jgi:hypothetical protein
MYERLLDKTIKLDDIALHKYLEQQAHECLICFENHLRVKYQLVRELKFPLVAIMVGVTSIATRQIICVMLFLKKTFFTVMLQIGDKQVYPFRT